MSLSRRTTTPAPAILGSDSTIGEIASAETNLDYAATTPPLVAAVQAVLEILPSYGSVHRGGGRRSALTTAAYERAREQVEAFLDVDDDHEIVFVRNSTEAINVVSELLPADARVLCSPVEHHANLLPWRRRTVEHLPFTETVDDLVTAAGEAFARAEASGRPFALLALSGASNVTGEVPPLPALVELAHDHGAEVLVDAAQLAPHRAVSVRDLDVDYLAVSGHKLYAPFGTGALVLRTRTIAHRPPLLHGGGAVRVVTLDDVVWSDAPQRFEAGTPNVVGAVALGAACDALAAYGMDRVAADERALSEELWSGLRSVPGLRLLRLWHDAPDVVGVATFSLAGHDPRQLADDLAAQWQISVRSGLFCAHPLVCRLLDVPPEETTQLVAAAAAGEDVTLPGAVRASLGLGVARSDVARLVEALQSLASPRPRGDGPAHSRWSTTSRTSEPSGATS